MGYVDCVDCLVWVDSLITGFYCLIVIARSQYLGMYLSLLTKTGSLTMKDLSLYQYQFSP